MEETGIVKSIDGVIAKVLVSRKSSCCESCEKDSCDIPENGIETEAINTAGAKVGQKVKIVFGIFVILILLLSVFLVICSAQVNAGCIRCINIIHGVFIDAEVNIMLRSRISGRPANGFTRLFDNHC